MKVNNTAIFMGDNSRSQRREGYEPQQQKQGNVIFAGNLNQQFDPIARKKQQARAQAMKIVSDAFAGESKIDDEVQGHRDKIDTYKKDMLWARKGLKDTDKSMEELRKSYGLTEEDGKQDNASEYEIADGDVLSKDERKVFEQFGADGLKEYKEALASLKEQKKYYKEKVDECEKGIQVESSIIEGIRKERLKHDPMGEAWEQADGVMEAASKEIVGMLMDEAKEHIDEEFEKKKEAAKEKAEEEKEEEEKLKKIKDKKDQQEEMNEAIAESVDQMLDVESAQTQVQDEIKKIMDELKLLEEDIKGAAVDRNV